MDEQQVTEEMIDILEDNGDIKLLNDETNISIQSVDDKEGYSYISNDHTKFESSREAVEWAIEQFDGVEYIEEWE